MNIDSFHSSNTSASTSNNNPTTSIEPDKNSCYVDIRKASEQVLNSSVVQASKNIIRIFINGYAIICDIEMLGKVKKVIEND